MADTNDDLNEAFDDQQLFAQINYDKSLVDEDIQSPVAESFVGAGFAKTVRLLHDVFGPPQDNKQSVSESRQNWELPKPFGRFEILQKVGQGAFGAVWKAYDPILKRAVAVKALHPELRSVPTLHERFEQEAQAAARLNHPNIVRVFEVGSIDNISYIVTEYVDGYPLQVNRDGRLVRSSRESAKIIAQLADAAHHSHLQGVLHRDIKPENVLMERLSAGEIPGVEVPRLTDFGLARLVDQRSSSSTFGMLVGSLDYMSPEQLLGRSEDVGPGSDIFALGVLLFQLISGQLPRQSNGSIFQAIESTRRIPDLLSLAPDTHRDLAAICHKCLAYDTADRFGSAIELRDDLNNFLADKPTLTRPPSSVERFARWTRANRSTASSLGLVLGSIVLAMLVSLYASYELANRNRELTQARDDSAAAQVVAQEHELRFRELAWHSGLQLAFGKLERGQLRGVRQALESLTQQHPSAKDRPEWQLLKSELDSHYQVLLNEPEPLREIVSIPQTTLLAIAGDNSYLVLYDYSTRTVVKRIDLGIAEIHALDVSPDGALLAVGGSTQPNTDQAVPVIIDWRKDAIRQLTVTGPTTIESLAFSPDNKRLAIGFRYEDVQVANLESSTEATLSIPASRRCRSIAWTSADHLVVHAEHGVLTVTDLSSREHTKLEFPEQVESFASSHSGHWLAVTNALSDGCTLASLSAPVEQRSLSGIASRAKCVAFSPDDRWLAAGADSGEVFVWEVASLLKAEEENLDVSSPAARRLILGGGVTSLVWQHDGLAIVGESGEAVLWSPAAAESLFSPQDPITAATFTSADQIALGTASGELTLSSIESNTPRSLSPRLNRLQSQLLHNGEEANTINSLTAKLDKWLFASTADGASLNLIQLRLSDLQQINSQVAWLNSNKITNVVSDLSSDGTFLAWGGSNNQLNVVQQSTGQTHIAEEFTGDIYAIRFLSDSLIAVGGQFEGVRVFDTETKLEVAKLGTAHAGAIFVDHPNQTLTVGFKDGILRCWTIGTWKPVYSLRTNESQIEAVTQNSSGSLGIAIDEKSNVVAFNPNQRLVYGRLRENIRLRERYAHTRVTAQISPDDQRLLLLMNFFKDDQIGSLLRLYDLGPDSQQISPND